MVAGEEQRSLRVIPDGERKIPEQVLDARLTPSLVRLEDQATIAEFDRPTTGKAEPLDQLGPIVQADVGHDHVAGLGVHEGELLEHSFGSRMQGAVAQGDSFTEPGAAVRRGHDWP